MRRVLALLALLGGCAMVPRPPATPPQPTSVPADQGVPPAASAAPPAVAAPAPAPAPEPGPALRKENVAVASLVERARAESAAGRLANAAASIERAIRIEPRNPRLWQELARVRLRQADYAQAESVARRSNSWAGRDVELRAENWRIIAEAREARGDRVGARAALDAAARQK